MEKEILTAKQIVEIITVDNKYYNRAKPQYKPSTAFRIVAAIKAGTCKSETERAFLNAFGYEVISEVTYQKNN